jgi:hypothetical protein
MDIRMRFAPSCRDAPVRGIAIATDEGRDAVHAAEGELQKTFPVTARFKPIRPSDADSPFIPRDETVLSFSRNHSETIAT